MSSTDDLPYTVVQQKERISADLNSTFLFQFLFGMYTGVFIVTLYIYYFQRENRRTSSSRIIIGSISTLYVTSAASFVWNWFYTYILTCTLGTRMEMFIESISEGLISMPEGVDILLIITSCLSFFIADGLLVWRCFHACGQSVYKISLPIGLFIVETGLLICMTVYTSLVNEKAGFATRHTVRVIECLDAAAYVTAALTSIAATFMIYREIHRRTESTPSSQSKRSYRTVIDALVQSSALYSVVAAIDAILSFGSTGKFQISYKTALGLSYVGATIDVVIGLAPTLMVARLFMSRPKEHTVHMTDTDQDMCQGDVEMQRDGAPGSGEEET